MTRIFSRLAQFTIGAGLVSALAVSLFSPLAAEFRPAELTRPSRGEVAPLDLVDEYQKQLDETGSIHFKFDPEKVNGKGLSVIELDRPLTINPSDRYRITSDNRVLVSFKGPPNRAMFEVVPPRTNSTWTGRFEFYDILAECRSGENQSFIRATYPRCQMSYPTFRNLRIKASGYAIDFDELDYSVLPMFSDLETAGGGALRFRGRRGGGDGSRYWSTSQMHVENWRHQGGDRIGPAFDLMGTGGLVMVNIIDEQSKQLHPKLVEAGWTGPISLRLEQPKFPALIRNYWCEAVKGKAPDCWVFEFRAEDVGAVGKSNTVDVYSLGYHGNWQDGPHTLRVIGGSSSADEKAARTHSIIVRIYDAWKPSGEKVATHGKAAVQYFRPLYQGAEKLEGLRERFYVEGVQQISTNHKPSTPDGPSHQIGFDRDNDVEFYEPATFDFDAAPEPEPPGDDPIPTDEIIE